MRTIVVTSQKGGSGKTTLVAHLAVAAELAGQGPVVVMDTDPQQTLATWWGHRTTDAPRLAPVTPRTLGETLDAIAKTGAAYCLIDTPPALTDQNRLILEWADLVLIPTRPSPADLWALGATVELVREAEALGYAFVLTQAKAHARITLQAMAALSEHGSVLSVIIHDRVDYAASMTDGQTVLELSRGSAAALEVQALWKVVHARLRDREKALKSMSETAKLNEIAKERQHG